MSLHFQLSQVKVTRYFIIYETKTEKIACLCNILSTVFPAVFAQVISVLI